MGPKGSFNLQQRQVEYPSQFVFRITRSPCIPTDDALTDLDRKYLRLFSKSELPVTGGFVISTGTHISPPNSGLSRLPVVICLPIFPYSSKTFRFACLALASAEDRSTTNPDSLQYIGKFHQYMKDSIDRSSFLEIFLASYVALAFEYYRTRRHISPIKNVFVFANGTWTAANYVAIGWNYPQPSAQDIAEIYSLMLWSIIFVHSAYFSAHSGQELVYLEIFKNGVAPVVNFISHLGLPMLPTRLRFLKMCLNIELDVFLSLKSRSRLEVKHGQSNSITQSLRKLIQYITDLHYEFPKARDLLAIVKDESLPPFWTLNFAGVPFDWTDVGYHHQGTFLNINSDLEIQDASLVFGLACLVKQLIDPCLDINRAVTQTYFICHLCYLTISSLSIINIGLQAQVLCWLGLKITRVVNANGISNKFDY